MIREQMDIRLRSVLSGLVIQSFRLVAGGTLILYLSHDPANQPSDVKPTRLWIESAWRLCSRNNVIAGSLDRPDILMAHLQKLVGMAVETVCLEGLPADIKVNLNCDLVIESFSRSVQDSQWEIRRPDGLRLGLGENLELFERTEEPEESGRLGTQY